MFWPCLPRKSKCEWSILRQFIAHYNTTFGSDFHLVKCLDVQDSTTKQPEVLLKDGRGTMMVVERKSIMPNDYGKYHKLGHTFTDEFSKLCSTLGFDVLNDVYVLWVSVHDLPTDVYAVRDVAAKIAETVISSKDQITKSRAIVHKVPIPWRFGRLPECERNEDTPQSGVGVFVYESEPDGFDLDAYDDARHEIQAQLERQLKSAEAKFVRYDDSIRVVVLEFYGDLGLILDEYVYKIIADTQIPAPIDQVWICRPEWVSEHDYEPRYEHLR